MKDGWKYKTIGDVCTSFSGYTPSSGLLKSSGAFPYFKVAEMNLPKNHKYLVSTNAYIDNPTKVFPKNSIVFPKNGAAIATNKKRILGQDSIVDLNTGGLNACDTILCHGFLYYVMQHIDFRLITRRGAVPTLDVVELKKTVIPIPPLSEQQHIVEELDLLSSIIEKKNAQLNELDNLAQSLFYEMFGDLIDNPKGWDIRKLGDILKIPSRNGLSKPTAIRGEGVPMISMGEMFANSIITDEVKASLVPVTERELETSQIVSGDLLFARQSLSLEGAGKCSYVKSCLHPTVFESHLIRIRVNSIVVLPQFVFCYFQTPCGIAEVRKRVYQVAAAGIKGSELIKIPIPVPPIDLQKEFASKIETIEHQKELIKQSIKEVETLFNSRMDYYFN